MANMLVRFDEYLTIIILNKDYKSEKNIYTIIVRTLYPLPSSPE